MTRHLLEALGRHRSPSAFLQGAMDRLMAYQPLSTRAKAPAGEAVGDPGALEQDGSLPWIEQPKKNAAH